jgi:hypothetical protein
MKSIQSRCVLVVAVLGALVSGCATTNAPRVVYPVTYQIPVGNTRVTANTGGQNLDVVARQRVEVYPGRRIYFRVVAPVDVTMRVYTGDRASAELVSEMRGSVFAHALLPKTSELEFTFGVSDANTSGTVQFTLSDRPLRPDVARSGP